jgi:excisionase family DNA binding protein
MLMTTREAAERRGCSERQVRRLCERRALDCVKVGGSWLVRADATKPTGREIRRLHGRQA